MVVYGLGRLESGESFGFVDSRARPQFYVRESDREIALSSLRQSGVSWRETERTTMRGESVFEVFADTEKPVRAAADMLNAVAVPTFEADVPLTRKYLIERGVRGSLTLTGSWQRGKSVDWVIVDPEELSGSAHQPELSLLSIDIETNREATRITAVSLVASGPGLGEGVEEVFVVGEGDPKDPGFLIACEDERELLRQFMRRVIEIDPDVITGWNVIDFDLKVIEERCRAQSLPFVVGRSRDECFYLKGDRWGGSRVTVYGRQVLDALHVVRNSLARFDDHRLETVAQVLLGRGKRLHAENGADMVAVIERAYAEDRSAFAEYCLEDARLVRDILEKENLIDLTLKRSLLTGLSLERAWGSVAAFDYLYIGALRRQGLVAPTANPTAASAGGAPGGFVFVPEAGLWSDVFVFDFKSLYPSIIRTFHIDPLALALGENAPDDEVITAPNDARFLRGRGLLPAILDVFFAKRDEAKAQGDDLASYTYKIVMNSFYGVLGTPSCRFATPKLAGGITRFGHYLLKWCRDLLETEGHAVLYGDTDSLFIDPHLPRDLSEVEATKRALAIRDLVNTRLSEHLLDKYGVDSRLELEFEKHYLKLFLPPSRGEELKGRAKGYAGLCKRNGKEVVEVVGLEAVRRDWTDVSHELQRHMLELMFHDASAADMEKYVFRIIREIKAGERDAQLVYRQAMRKPVSEYTKTTPPHVKAARLLDNPSGVIKYLITIHGPQPTAKLTSPIDYAHYIEKQIEPIVRAFAPFCGIDAHAIFTGEQRLF